MGLFTPSAKSGDNKKKKSGGLFAKQSIPNTAQKTIPYVKAYDSGIIEVAEKTFSKTYFVEDINFKIEEQNLQETIFLKFGDFLNMFGNAVKAEFTIYNRSIVPEEFNKRALLEYQGDNLDPLREETNKILLDKIAEGRNNIKKEIYLTVTIEEENEKNANNTFIRLDSEISSALKAINGATCKPLNINERMSLLYDIYHPDDTGALSKTAEIDGHKDVKAFDLQNLKNQGLSSKDAIAPVMLSFDSNSFKIDDYFGQVICLQNLPTFLSTEFIGEINDCPFNLLTSIHYDSLRQEKAARLVKNQILNINSDILDKQKKASRSGYSADLISPELTQAKEEAQKLMTDMSSRNQKLFYVTLVITHFAKDMETLNKQSENIMSIGQKYLVGLRRLTSQQELGFNSSLPLGNNKLFLKRLLTTETASLFIPFSTVELSQNRGIYYGLNAISRNMILFDRTASKNANGIILGTPGSGKSFSAKREILSVLLGTDADVYIIDPEGEYTPLAMLLGGEIVKLQAGGKTYINPLDMDLNYADDEDPVTLKADFVCSLCETVMGGRFGLSTYQKSIIDRCVRNVYRPYLDYMAKHPELGSADYTKVPTLKHLYQELLKQEESEARVIALGLERFVTGSLDIFSKRTNVNIRKRFVVYNILEIGKGLKEMGIQVCLNDIWNRTIANKRNNRRTWFYIDEFYLLTQTESSATFLQEIFKRARKWGGVPTGITQNIEDLLISKEARTILANCDFVMMLNQAPNDRQSLAKQYHLSPQQLSYITNSEAGQGLLYTGKTFVPFVDKYPRNTKTFAAMTSSVQDVELQRETLGIESGADISREFTKATE